ncbi:efflux RND transporter periplasmic adaptor subunit [Ensifer sp.]|uniref:efflux RND transporter periplasmic adaptor subunit n=1 Tax=Ensifer sp. TaxID=1872086 RepID=UPI0028981194|nr:efflux RND transporter periplasmic adaptor subunit [Ensifer sp.]
MATRCRNNRHVARLIGVALATALAGAAMAEDCNLQHVEGFTEPAATVEVAAREPGIVATMRAEVGQRVSAGDVLAELDKTIAQGEVDSARVRALANGRIAIAEARRDLARRKMTEVAKLEKSRAVRPLEIIEARAELQVAEAEVEAVLDERRTAELALASAVAHLSLLDIKAPFDGVVSAIHRKQSELAGAGGDARLVTLLKLETLNADFFVPVACFGDISAGTALDVRLAREGRVLKAQVRDVGSEIDAPTGLRRIGIEIANPDYRLLSGERIVINLPIRTALR